MATRIPRSTAATRVARAAETSSDETLDIETAAFGEIEDQFGLLAAAVAAALLDAPDLNPAAAVWDIIAALINGAQNAVGAIVGGLIRVSVIASLSSHSDELGAVEATLPGRHRGTASRAVSKVDVEGIVEAAVERYSEVTKAATDRLVDDIAKEADRWRSGDRPSKPELVERLTAERPVPERGRPPKPSKGTVPKEATRAKQRARETVIDAENQARETAMDEFNKDVVSRGDPPMIYKQVLSVIDNRTTVICLHAAGQIKPLDTPFDTLNGTRQRPPFHWGCRSLVVPWAAGMVQPWRHEANKELVNRPLPERRIGPNGEIGGPLPGGPVETFEDPLPDELAANPRIPIDEVPAEHRLAYMRANPDRFRVNGTEESTWVTDSLGRRWNLRG